jgi:hypothetical protein
METARAALHLRCFPEIRRAGFVGVGRRDHESFITIEASRQNPYQDDRTLPGEERSRDGGARKLSVIIPVFNRLSTGNIRLFFQSKNCGKGTASRRGFREARGQIVLNDVWTGYKAMRREVAQSLDLKEDHFSFEPEFSAKVARDGWRISEVPVSYFLRKSDAGKKLRLADGRCGIASKVLLFGVSTYGDWYSPNQLTFNVLIDTNQDGAEDFQLFNTSLPNAQGGPGDVFVTRLRNLQTGNITTTGSRPALAMLRSIRAAATHTTPLSRGWILAAARSTSI